MKLTDLQLSNLNDYFKRLRESSEIYYQQLECVANSLDKELPDYPIAICSYKYNPKRSKTFELLASSNFKKNIYVFAYEEQRELYKQFESELNVVYLPKRVNIAFKRQFVVDYFAERGVDHILMLDDDIHQFRLPIRSLTANGVMLNKYVIVSFDEMMFLWTAAIHEKKLDFSGFCHWFLFRFRDFEKHDFFGKYGGYSQLSHMNVQKMKEYNIRYDIDQGWEDFDLLLQILEAGLMTYTLGFTYVSEAAGKVNSTFDELPNRAARSSLQLIAKHGLNLLKFNLTKGIFNISISRQYCAKHAKESSIASQVEKYDFPESIYPEIFEIINSDKKGKSSLLKNILNKYKI